MADIAERTGEIATTDDGIERVSEVLVRRCRASDGGIPGIEERENMVRCVVQSPVNHDALSNTRITDSII